jgi:hypothetical protein
LIGDQLEGRWLDFTNFVSVPAHQAWVGRGTNADGAVAYLKVHTEVAAFQREYAAYQRLEVHHVSPPCLAVDELKLRLLTADAGRPLVDEAQTSELGLEMWSVLRRMHEVSVPDDPLPMAAALRLRWDRLSNRLGRHCSSALNTWILNRLLMMPDVPRALVHRDLRPAHWFRRGADVRLIDFGQSRVDAVLFDAVPFYSGVFAPPIEAVIREQFELTYGTHMMNQVDVFAVLYLCGTIERIVYLDDVAEWPRARLLKDSLVKWSNAPLDFGGIFKRGTLDVVS